jgi:outer membrane protein OmpA-like peptidoglycan-associated protein
MRNCLFGLMCCCLLLTACKQRAWEAVDNAYAENRTSITRGTIHPERIVKASHSLVRQIEAVGGKVIVLGDNTSIILPSDPIFEPTTSQFLESAFYEDHPILTATAKLLSRFPRSAVKISVGVDDTFSAADAEQLTRQRADRLAGYLWRHGVAAWRLFTVPYGKEALLGFNRTVWGKRDNRFIEITTNPYIGPWNEEYYQWFLYQRQSWQYWGSPY